VFLLACWWWSRLEIKAEKRKLRETLVFICGVCFFSLIGVAVVARISAFALLLLMSFDGILILGIALNFALQTARISRSIATICSVVFAILNFLPVLWRHGLSTREFRSRFIWLSPGVHLFELLLVMLVVRIAINNRALPAVQILSQETYMGSKYHISGGQQGAVGDNASASEFTQQSKEESSQRDFVVLAGDLSSLHSALIARDEDQSHAASIQEVSHAELAAKRGDNASLMKHLRDAGSWVLDVAKEVSTSVLKETIEQALKGGGV
jgi:hypothetical protein